MPLHLVDDDDPPKPICGARMRLAIEREMHTAYVQATGTAQGRLTDSLYDIRRGRQFPWRKELTRIEEFRVLKAKKAAVQEIAFVLLRYIDLLWADEQQSESDYRQKRAA